MEIIGCGKGHYYNPELYSSCPECAKENGGADFLGATEPVDFGNYANNFGNVGATEPVGFGGFAGGGSNVGKTEPVGFGVEWRATNGRVSAAASVGAFAIFALGGETPPLRTNTKGSEKRRPHFFANAAFCWQKYEIFFLSF